MKILILGSGQVGSTVAQNLASVSSNDVTVIDIDEKALQHIGSRLDVQTILGNGASPFILEQAGAADSDLLLALTRSDETNIVACKIAADLFNIPSRIAASRSSEYLEYPYPRKRRYGKRQALPSSTSPKPSAPNSSLPNSSSGCSATPAHCRY